MEVDRIIDCRDRTTEVPLTDAEMDALEEEEKQVQEEEEEEEEEEGQKGIDNNNSSSSSAAAASATAGLEEGGEEGLEMEDDLAFLEKEAASGSGSSGSSGIGSGGKGLSLGGGKGARACEYKGFHFCRPSPPLWPSSTLLLVILPFLFLCVLVYICLARYRTVTRSGKTLTVMKAEADPVWQPLRRCGKVKETIGGRCLSLFFIMSGGKIVMFFRR